MFWKCKHPVAALAAEDDLTSEKIDNDFDKITYNLTCLRCGQSVKISYAKLRGGVDEFFKRNNGPTYRVDKNAN